MKSFFKKIFKKKPKSPETLIVSKRKRLKKAGERIRRRLPKSLDDLKFDPRNVRLESISENQTRIRWTLILLAILLTAAIASRITGIFLKPTYTSIPPKKIGSIRNLTPQEDLTPIESRNIFDVENKIPDPFDQGMLDCLSQAKPSSARMSLLGTIVMSDETLSVALVQDEGSALKLAVKKDETFFDGKYQALKIDRKKFCFQVKSTQDFEYIEIPEEGGGLEVGGPAIVSRSREGIATVGQNKFQVKQSFLDSQMGNLTEILQTAKAVPYMDGGKMKGFLIQSVDPDSIFTSLGLGAGDVLKEVNGIMLDNAGKGLEAFQTLRGARSISLRVTRGGQEETLTYEVK